MDKYYMIGLIIFLLSMLVLNKVILLISLNKTSQRIDRVENAKYKEVIQGSVRPAPPKGCCSGAARPPIVIKIIHEKEK